MLRDCKVRCLYNFQLLPLPKKMREVTFSHREIEEELHRLSVRFLTIEPVEVAQEGDYVLLLFSEKKRQYVSSRDNMLTGCRVGDRMRCGLEEGTVLSIKRRMLPPVTDELVCRLKLPGIETVEAYEASIRSQLTVEHGGDKLQGIVNYLARETFQRSSVEDLCQEVDWYYAYLLEYYRQWAQREGTSYEDVLSSQTPQSLKTTAEREDYLRTHSALEGVRLAALGFALAEQEGKAVPDEQFEQECLQRYQEQGVVPSAEEVRRTAQVQQIFHYAQYFADAVWAYMQKQFIPIVTN